MIMCLSLSLNPDVISIGGINKETAKQVEKADVIVSGSFLFNHPKSLSQGVLDILENA